MARAKSNREGSPPGFWKIADVFIRYGNFTLGGGSATTATLHRELVTKREWVDDEHFTLSFALARLTPGTNVLAFCVGIGWMLRRTGGALAALVGGSVPCAIMVIVLTALFSRWQENQVAQVALHGAVAAAVAITAKTSWTIARPFYKAGARLRVVLVGAAAFALYVWCGLSPIQVLLLAALVGACLPVARR